MHSQLKSTLTKCNAILLSVFEKFHNHFLPPSFLCIVLSCLQLRGRRGCPLSHLCANSVESLNPFSILCVEFIVFNIIKTIYGRRNSVKWSSFESLQTPTSLFLIFFHVVLCLFPICSLFT